MARVCISLFAVACLATAATFSAFPASAACAFLPDERPSPMRCPVEKDARVRQDRFHIDFCACLGRPLAALLGYPRSNSQSPLI